MDDNTTGTGPDDKACVSVRYADEKDLPQVLAMYLDALKEINDQNIRPNPVKCARQVVDSYNRAPCVLLEKQGDIIGFAGLDTNIPIYSDDAYISEYMFYVKPGNRSIKMAKMLSDAVQAVADKFKLPLYFSHILYGLGVDHKEKFLKRWGYKPLAVNCVYEVKHV